MERVVNSVPIDRTLLLSQHEHKSKLLWKGEISFCSLMKMYDRALVTTMIECWRPETHCFHLPFGEVTITLHDVEVLFCLHIDNNDVYMQDSA
ncbi:hypothetical protein R3W88_031492 [Solanum pinnatisectum]|uniref:Aminotransferase-like plant mobile domain-containing protein n=1 Tax=Solanum pinnatisectum TaxID=50273 RepID=A0AAV9LQ63_9SOLN|nr:hypothetical protein R3W88_031492 [Solanum pinnatisectum]